MSASLAATLLAGLHVVLAIVVSGHIVLTKDDVRSAIGWIGLVWLTPVLGSVLYVLLGINRINRQARPMRRGPPLDPADRAAEIRRTAGMPAPDVLPRDAPPPLHAIARVTGTVTRLPLVN